jgi:hypothetical protein
MKARFASVILVSALLAVQGVTDAATAMAEENGIYLAAKAKLLGDMKTCGFTDQKVTLENYSTPDMILAHIGGDEKSYGDAAVKCLAEKTAGNNGQIDFLDGDADIAFRKLTGVATEHKNLALLEFSKKAALACGVDATSINAKSFEEWGGTIIIEGTSAKLNKNLLSCLSKTAFDNAVNYNFEDANVSDLYYDELSLLKSEHDLVKAKGIYKTLKLRGKFEIYDPKKQSLISYGKRTEALCGAKPGKYLRLFEGNYLTWNFAPSGVEQYPELAGTAGCIWTLLSLAELEKQGASFGPLMITPVPPSLPSNSEKRN